MMLIEVRLPNDSSKPGSCCGEENVFGLERSNSEDGVIFICTMSKRSKYYYKSKSGNRNVQLAFVMK